MSSLDILACSAIVAVACYPAVKAGVSRLIAGRLPTVSLEETPQAWQQRWTHTLIELLNELERDQKKAAATLCRELMWEVIGGDQKGGSK